MFCHRLSKIQVIGSERPFLLLEVESHHWRLDNANCYHFWCMSFSQVVNRRIKYFMLFSFWSLLAIWCWYRLMMPMSRYLWNSEGVNLHQMHCSDTMVYCQSQPLHESILLLSLLFWWYKTCSLVHHPSLRKGKTNRRKMFYTIEIWKTCSDVECFCSL